jgi:hypothetical protein
MIAKQYCNCLVRADKKSIGRAATAQAAKLLGRIVRDGVARLTKAAVAVPKEWAKGFADWLFAKSKGLAQPEAEQEIVIGDRYGIL